MVLADGAGTPLGVYLDSASPQEVKLLEKTLDAVQVKRKEGGRRRFRPDHLIADKGYDSDEVRRMLRERGIEPVIPHRSNRIKPPTQDGRKLRRYRRRWIIERTIGWIGNFRRLSMRYDRLLETYGGFFHIACALITLRKVL
jgi:transposase